MHALCVNKSDLTLLLLGQWFNKALPPLSKLCCMPIWRPTVELVKCRKLFWTFWCGRINRAWRKVQNKWSGLVADVRSLTVPGRMYPIIHSLPESCSADMWAAAWAWNWDCVWGWSLAWGWRKAETSGWVLTMGQCRWFLDYRWQPKVRVCLHDVRSGSVEQCSGLFCGYKKDRHGQVSRQVQSLVIRLNKPLRRHVKTWSTCSEKTIKLLNSVLSSLEGNLLPAVTVSLTAMDFVPVHQWRYDGCLITAPIIKIFLHYKRLAA